MFNFQNGEVDLSKGNGKSNRKSSWRNRQKRNKRAVRDQIRMSDADRIHANYMSGPGTGNTPGKRVDF